MGFKKRLRHITITRRNRSEQVAISHSLTSLDTRTHLELSRELLCVMEHEAIYPILHKLS